MEESALENISEEKDVKDAKTTVKFSHTYRYIILGAVMVIGIFVPIFDMVATIASIFFSSLGIYVRFFAMKRNGTTNPVAAVTADNADTTDTTPVADTNVTEEVSEE